MALGAHFWQSEPQPIQFPMEVLLYRWLLLPYYSIPHLRAYPYC